MINILINSNYSDQIIKSELETAASSVLQEYSNYTEFELTIAIEGDNLLCELNSKFLGINKPTDVLSFPSGQDEIDPDTGLFYLGDIIISFPIAERQAKTYHHPVMSELTLLVVHGVLHLLGYDHVDEKQKNEMWAAQNLILQKMGIFLNVRPEFLDSSP